MPLATATIKSYPEADATKLAGIAEGAEVNPADLVALDLTASTKLAAIEDEATADQTGEEVRDLVVALPVDEREIVVTNPAPTEHKVYSLKRNAAGELDYDFNDVPEA